MSDLCIQVFDFLTVSHLIFKVCFSFFRPHFVWKVQSYDCGARFQMYHQSGQYLDF